MLKKIINIVCLAGAIFFLFYLLIHRPNPFSKYEHPRLPHLLLNVGLWDKANRGLLTFIPLRDSGW